MADLTSDYDVDVRPVQHTGDVLNVDMDIAIMQIVDLDEVNQILKSKVKLYFVSTYLLCLKPSSFL